MEKPKLSLNTLENHFRDKRVLVTGHTGFKGSWLSIWLNEMGAKVSGYSLPEPITVENNFTASKLERNLLHDLRGDIRQLDSFEYALQECKPDIVFHLAAQAIVLTSYEKPKETLETNVQGTINVLEAIRRAKSPTTFVGVTTDKVYENQEWDWGYRESDRLGGKDPYAASKAMAELAIASYRSSFFSPEKFSEHGVAIASARAGNVIGGGDFADFRLVPDIMRALSKGEPVKIRNPWSIRPWQHVLEPLSGYLLLAAKLSENPEAYSEAWNFGPRNEDSIPCNELVNITTDQWGSGTWVDISEESAGKKETRVLRLNCDKAYERLGWNPAYNVDDAIRATVDWHKEYEKQKASGNVDMYSFAAKQINDYFKAAWEAGSACAD